MPLKLLLAITTKLYKMLLKYREDTYRTHINNKAFPEVTKVLKHFAMELLAAYLKHIDLW